MIDFLQQLAREAGERLLALQHTDLKRFSKGSFDYATEADLQSQELLVSRLTAAYPGIAILAEEQDDHPIPDGDYFAIDPLDGTISYSAGSNSWGVILTYMEQGRPAAGVIYMPAENRMLSATSGGGAALNGKPVTLRPVQHLAACLAGIDIGAWLGGDSRENTVLPLIENALSIRSLGSSAASLCDLAAGITSLYVSASGAKIWDLATGYLVVKEAGGVAYDLSGGELVWEEVLMTCLYAACDGVAQELLEIYRSAS